MKIVAGVIAYLIALAVVLLFNYGAHRNEGGQC